MKTNNRRPDGWTSADAAGLAIFPGLVRYDEAWNAAVTDIGHAFRVTVRATNGYVYPASHRAGSTSGALPMGARLRLKKNVGGADPALRSNDPNVQKIFRAMQKYGLIVADNGSDMYIAGTFDSRWSNDILNPAFALITASDFEVVQLGWNPPAGAPALTSIGANPNQVVGGAGATGTVALSSAAPAGATPVALSSGSSAVTVPANVSIPQGATSATFGIATSVVSSITSTTLAATYGGVTKTTTFTITAAATAPALATLSLNRTSVVGGTSAVGTLTLTGAAPSGGATVALTSSQPQRASVPAKVVVAAGATSATFTVSTFATKKNAAATLSATYAGVTKTTTIKIIRR